MRKELYNMLCQRLKTVGEGAIRHIDLWNNNVDFIEQEEAWERPAVFIEFMPIKWAVVKGGEYRAEPEVRLHVVTDWQGSAADGSAFKDESLEVFDLSQQIHEAVSGMAGATFRRFDLKETLTNHNHEEILENIEVYQCVATRKILSA